MVVVPHAKLAVPRAGSNHSIVEEAEINPKHELGVVVRPREYTCTTRPTIPYTCPHVVTHRPVSECVDVCVCEFLGHCVAWHGVEWRGLLTQYMTRREDDILLV